MEAEKVLDEISSKYIARIAEERKTWDERQLAAISATLRDWSAKLQADFKAKPIGSTSDSSNDHDMLRGALGEAKERQNKIIAEMKDAHKQQLEILRLAVSEERREALQAQQIFEDTLRSKYENMVQSLQEKVKFEQEARMKRSLEDLERSTRAESERAKQMFEAQQTAELAVSTKFKHLISDLRRSWEEEEAGRARQLEERLRHHYSAVLEHMESQLQMSLKLQDDVDKQWLEDVEARNRQQVTTMRAFEDKCRRLYDTRLTEYVEHTDKQLSEYENQLLQVGSAMAMDRSKFESRLRRLRLACGRWKAEYQRDIHLKYTSMATALETRYMGEVESLLEELAASRSRLTAVEHEVQRAERDLFEEKRLVESLDRKLSESDREKKSGRSSLVAQRDALLKLWQGLGTPAEERVAVLVQLLDAADYSPELASKYESIQKRLSARLPITQMLTRKQYVEYKLKYIQKVSSSTAPEDTSARSEALASKPSLLSELSDLKISIDTAVREYEQQYGERFVRPAPSGPSTAASPDKRTPLRGGGNDQFRAEY